MQPSAVISFYIKFVATYRIWHDRSSLAEYTHSGIQVRLKSRANRKSYISETRQNGYLDVAAECLALKVLKKNAHEWTGVLRTLFTQST